MLGWDIGGVNTKVARVRDGEVLAVRVRPFELQRDPANLVPLLRELTVDVGADPGASEPCAVTMTAELSQLFRTKREGVGFVLDAVEDAFPLAAIHVFAVDGRFLPVAEARQHPLLVAAANWAATARLAAVYHRDAILVDMGTTTTDIIPIAGGEVAATGTTDPDRLASGELVYTGALRTPVEAVVRRVPYRAGTATVSAEAFALMGDVHVWRGDLDPRDYTVPTPDGRPVTHECCGERLARVICADRDMLDEHDIARVAAACADAQVAQVAAGIEQVRGRHPSLRTAVVVGLGAFAAAAAARAAGLTVVELSPALEAGSLRSAPAAAVALLGEQACQGDGGIASAHV
jgi:probable H4MPT-linked C1 transfer pathway protein